MNCSCSASKGKKISIRIKINEITVNSAITNSTDSSLRLGILLIDELHSREQKFTKFDKQDKLGKQFQSALYLEDAAKQVELVLRSLT